MATTGSVQTFGRKKTATAVAFVKRGSGLIKINGVPISLCQPEILRLKTYEPVLLVGQDRFQQVDVRVRVKGGGTTSQIYAIRQAIAKGIVAYYQKYVDEAQKKGDVVKSQEISTWFVMMGGAVAIALLGPSTASSLASSLPSQRCTRREHCRE